MNEKGFLFCKGETDKKARKNGNYLVSRLEKTEKSVIFQRQTEVKG
jgi:hypothetical protein